MEELNCSAVGTLEKKVQYIYSFENGIEDKIYSCSCHAGYGGDFCEKNVSFNHLMHALSKSLPFYIGVVVGLVLYSLMGYIRTKDTNLKPRSNVISLIVQRNFALLFASTVLFSWWHYIVDKRWSSSILYIPVFLAVDFTISVLMTKPRIDPTYVKVGGKWCYYPEKRRILKLYGLWLFMLVLLIVLFYTSIYYFVITIEMYWASYRLVVFFVGLLISEHLSLPVTIIEVIVYVVNVLQDRNQPKEEKIIVEVLSKQLSPDYQKGNQDVLAEPGALNFPEDGYFDDDEIILSELTNGTITDYSYTPVSSHTHESVGDQHLEYENVEVYGDHNVINGELGHEFQNLEN